MKIASTELAAHLAGDALFDRKFLKITRTDGVTHCYTDDDVDREIGGDLYLALGGIKATALQSSTGYGVDNLEVAAVLEETGLTDTAFMAGRFDYAAYELFTANVRDLSQGTITEKTGYLGEWTLGDLTAKIELRSLMQKLLQVVGRTHQIRCDNNLGDERCGVNLAAFTVTGTITAVASRIQFTVSVPPGAAQGLFSFTSGNNNGFSREVERLSGSVVRLVLPIPFDIAINDTYSVYRGCNKLFSTCKTVFSNQENHGGFQYMPGNDALLR